MLMEEERRLIAEYGRKLSAAGLCPGTSGNISIMDRGKGLMAISPSGMDYDIIEAEDVPVCTLCGEIAEGSRKPSSELQLHLAFYREKPHIAAIVHTHSVFCSVFAALGEPLRAVHYAIGDAGTDVVPCAPYRLFGTKELSEAAVASCGESDAVLLANHGIVCCGEDIKSAYSLAKGLEYVAEVQYRAMCIGKPHILTRQQMEAVIDKVSSYGQK